jgi:lipoprotein-releasing system permease protein
MNGMVWQIALRYLRGKRSANAVPILSRISMLAIAVGSGALIVLFSVFNGFEGLVQELYKAFYPELRITAAKGKFFELSPAQQSRIAALPGIRRMSQVIEDNVLVNSNEEQLVVRLKGIDDHFISVNDIKPYIIEGNSELQGLPQPTAIIGMHIANQLGLDVRSFLSRLTVYYPNADAGPANLDPSRAFQSLQLKPEGVFRVQDEFDSRYVLAPLAQARELFRQPGRISSLEIAMDEGADGKKLKEQIAQMLGNAFVVETRFEQNRTLYMVMRTEKWAVYAILLLVLLIASFNMVGALSLLVLEKQKDVAILRAMGARPATIRLIFVLEGMLWALVGGGIGLLLGLGICLGQQHFQWIKLQGAFIIEAYPVVLQGADFALVIATVLVVGLLAAWYPAMRATRVDAANLRAS